MAISTGAGKLASHNVFLVIVLSFLVFSSCLKLLLNCLCSIFFAWFVFLTVYLAGLNYLQALVHSLKSLPSGSQVANQ